MSRNSVVDTLGRRLVLFDNYIILQVASIEGFFDREVKRLQYFEERARNRAEAKSQSEAAPVVVPKEESEAAAKKEYEAYLELERKLLIELGLLHEEVDE